MRPYGYKIKGGCDCIYCGNKNPKSKKAVRQKAKKEIKIEFQNFTRKR